MRFGIEILVDMSNTFKKAGSKISQIPQRIQELVTEETREKVPEEAKRQIFREKPYEPSITPKGDTNPTESLKPEEVREIEKKAQKRYQELKAQLEKEIQEARRKRQEKESEWREAQEKQMTTPSTTESKPLIPPKSVPTRGAPPFFVKEKQKGVETAKRPTG